jgi:hypothetical protein
MATRPRNVDMGPMYLTVGEEAGPERWISPDANAESSDVSRFAAIMNRDKGQQRHAPPAPEALFGATLETDTTEFASADDVCTEIAFLWVGTGLSSDREVRVGLRESLLPDTAVRLFESEGRLRIEFTCGTSRVAEWLVRKLPVLARELGERLNRPLELAVLMKDGDLVGSINWPEDA